MLRQKCHPQNLLTVLKFSITVKEQCVVLFPYNAVNDDELSLKEGQTINIVTKDVEDKGWWKGEVDGRVGVFPDNFVKLITSAGGSNGGTPAKKTNSSAEEVSEAH